MSDNLEDEFDEDEEEEKKTSTTTTKKKTTTSTTTKTTTSTTTKTTTMKKTTMKKTMIAPSAPPSCPQLHGTRSRAAFPLRSYARGRPWRESRASRRAGPRKRSNLPGSFVQQVPPFNIRPARLRFARNGMTRDGS